MAIQVAHYIHRGHQIPHPRLLVNGDRKPIELRGLGNTTTELCPTLLQVMEKHRPSL
ncbi:MAG TPA: hypothetical protein VJ302_37780 [Blastocatellia bacterium]|nr:hypothetical protein [Blastocatellia bacterium]